MESEDDYYEEVEEEVVAEAVVVVVAVDAPVAIEIREGIPDNSESLSPCRRPLLHLLGLPSQWTLLVIIQRMRP